MNEPVTPIGPDNLGAATVNVITVSSRIVETNKIVAFNSINSIKRVFVNNPENETH